MSRTDHPTGDVQTPTSAAHPILPSAHRRGSRRFVDSGPIGRHPRTTLATPLLPARFLPGARVSVWEELDRAAAWVADSPPADLRTVVEAPGGSGPDALRQTLRVLCVAARSADGGVIPVLRPGELPSAVPVSRLIRALQQRLVAQTAADIAAGDPTADPTHILRVLQALDRLDEQIQSDAVRTTRDQLTGVTALDLLVEVAHDMRSPLGSILFLVERLRDEFDRGDVPTPGQDRRLALVYGAAFGLSRMVDDVMELARGGDRLAVGNAEPLRIPEIVENVCAIVRPLADEKHLALVVGALPAGPRLGHVAALQRVLLNLVTNAVKYTPEGSVTIRAEVQGSGGGRVAFVVEDTGRGIPASVLANLFQTFRQRPAHDYAFSSAGLGLAICQRLINALGGTLDVHSEPERGTRFTFAIDLVPVAADIPSGSGDESRVRSDAW